MTNFLHDIDSGTFLTLFTITHVPCLEEGEWLDGKRFGYGIFRYENGDRYMGEWKDGYRWGVLSPSSPCDQASFDNV